MTSTSSSFDSTAQITAIDSVVSIPEEPPDLKEYSTQYFGFTPKSFTNGIYNAMIDYIQIGVKAMEEYVIQEFSDVMAASQVEDASQKILCHLTSKVDKSMDTFETYTTNNVFSIPPHVVLPEDQLEAECQYTEKDEKKVDEEIKQLMDKAMAIKYANGKLLDEVCTIDKVQERFDDALSQLHQLDKVSLECGVSDPKDTLIHAAGSIMEQMSTIPLLQGLASPQKQRKPPSTHLSASQVDMDYN